MVIQLLLVFAAIVIVKTDFVVLVEDLAGQPICTY